MRILNGCLSILVAFMLASVTRSASAASIRVAPDEKDRRVDILVDGKPFTSYIFPTTLKKPVLFPLRTAKGTIITRGFPPGPGERTDHPHHVGLWFNYANVDGIDFWNNSDAIPPERRNKMGTIEHRRIVGSKSGKDKGELEVEADWNGPDGKPMLHEHTLYVFRGGPAMRSIDRITTLTAVDHKVTFTDEKDGLLGMRVVRSLELPGQKTETFTDASGHATTVGQAGDHIATGDYLTSEGKRGDAAWGTRGRWCELSGTVNQEPVTILVLDHPGNPGAPTYWHARGYGLFAANPLGQKAFSDGKEELNFALAPKQSATFRHRILIISGGGSSDRAEKEYQDFVAAYR